LLPEIEGGAVGSGRLDEGILLPQKEIKISEKDNAFGALGTSGRTRHTLLT
jgi:hypothetical protein